MYRYKLDRSHSVVEWDAVSPRMSKDEADAMSALLDLSSQGLLDHVRTKGLVQIIFPKDFGPESTVQEHVHDFEVV